MKCNPYNADFFLLESILFSSSSLLPWLYHPWRWRHVWVALMCDGLMSETSKIIYGLGEVGRDRLATANGKWLRQEYSWTRWGICPIRSQVQRESARAHTRPELSLRISLLRAVCAWERYSGYAVFNQQGEALRTDGGQKHDRWDQLIRQRFQRYMLT